MNTNSSDASAELRFRQVHLDFHTSEKILDVGRDFSDEPFAKMLKVGAVDSITLFAKCHHGMSYHETKIGRRHPGLQVDLLKRQLGICRRNDVKTPIYLSAGFDEFAAEQHPEWTVKGKGGAAFDPLFAGWKMLCFNTPYLDYLCAQVEEVIDIFGAEDGIFLDIIQARPCYCKWCMEGMSAAEIDPKNDAAAAEYGYRVLDRYFERTTASSKKGNAARRVFHNSGHIAKGAHKAMRWNSHLELESLPTGGWGYDHFPISAKYAATTGFDFLGMTGKFHTTWGEFGGFKRKAALRYECAAMLAFGSKCSVGDQLHPRGAMNTDTYELIGAAYEEVASKEEWCRGAKPVSEIALVSPEAMFSNKPGHDRDSSSEIGAARMLLEMQMQFDVIDLDRDLSLYKLVVLPDEITLEGAFLEKVKTYLDRGGKLVMSGDSGLNRERDAFALDIGLELVGRSEWNPDYVLPTEMTPTLPVRGAFVMHGAAWDVKIVGANSKLESDKSSPRSPHSDAWQVMARRARPYFNRQWNHFCSHQHTADSEEIAFPALLGNGQIAYFAHAIFMRYRFDGQPLTRDLVRDAIESLLPQKSLETTLPTAARASLMRQAKENRYLLHLLYATPTLRGGQSAKPADAPALNIEVIEDLVPLFDVKCRVRLDEITDESESAKTVRSVRLVPSGEAIEYSIAQGAVLFTVPQLLCHQMVEISC